MCWGKNIRRFDSLQTCSMMNWVVPSDCARLVSCSQQQQRQRQRQRIDIAIVQGGWTRENEQRMWECMTQVPRRHIYCAVATKCGQYVSNDTWCVDQDTCNSRQVHFKISQIPNVVRLGNCEGMEITFHTQLHSGAWISVRRRQQSREEIKKESQHPATIRKKKAKLCSKQTDLVSQRKWEFSRQ